MKSVSQIPGVTWADVNFASGLMVLEYDPAADPRARAVEVVRSSGHGVEPLQRTGEETGAEPAPQSWWSTHGHEASTGAAAVLIAVAWMLGRVGGSLTQAMSVFAYALAIASGGWLIFRRALASVRARTLDMNVLMTVAVIGAGAIGEWAEAAAVVFLFSVGGLLESRSLARTRRSIRNLMDLTPPTARVSREGVASEVGVSEVAVGELISIRPGERVPLDGVVEGGVSAVDESPITGESVPADKTIGDAVFAGSLNTSGHLEVRVSSVSGDSTLARIIHLVEEAQSSRAPSQQFVERFTRSYTPLVVALATMLAALPPALGSMLGYPWGSFEEWLYRALVVLVVSCPCALVISTPVSIVSAITRATRDGVLVKGGAHLEAAARISVVAFDKTGTLTCGEPEVTDVVPLDTRDPEQVLALAAALEEHNNHPLARAVVRAAGELRPAGAVTGYEDVAGGGVRASIDGVPHAVGTLAFVAEKDAATPEASTVVADLEAEGRTVLVLAENTHPIGVIGVADQVRPDAAAAVKHLLAGGVSHVVMLTGDNERTAAAVAAHAGVSEFRARLLPHQKVESVHELRAAFGPVAMVGDGINDAPALAASDLGIAMGAAGSDAALETADVALMSDDLSQVPRFFDLGKRTVSIIRQNVAVSVIVKAVVLGLAMTGTATLWMAVFADTGVSLLVIFNGLRLLARRS